ncbi:MAG: hypothetical protein DRH12_14765, partial [Deltaproteobacteria bacterium]
SANYKPFGEAIITTYTITNPFRFPGQYYDQETGLHYNYLRYYEPHVKKYLSPDKVKYWNVYEISQYLQGMDFTSEHGSYKIERFDTYLSNLYEYANCNPLSYTDYYGLLGVLAGFSVRSIRKGYAGEASLLGVYLGKLSPGKTIFKVEGPSMEFFPGWGASFGRGFWLGIWTGSYCDLQGALEYGVDTPKTPLGSFSILYNPSSKNFGILIGGASAGGGVLLKNFIGIKKGLSGYQKVFTNPDPLNQYLLGP